MPARLCGMSISFIADVSVPRQAYTEPCLCAQMAPMFSSLFRGESDDWASLAEYAAPGCAECSGTGIERGSRDGRPQENFANDNARIVAQAMGLDFGDGYGSCELAVFRRALIRARNVRQPEALRAAEAGSRFYVAGYTSDDLSRALGRLERLASEAQRMGASCIVWG
jgi:hypothetical protein